MPDARRPEYWPAHAGRLGAQPQGAMETWAAQREGHSGPAPATCTPPVHARAAPLGQAMTELLDSTRAESAQPERIMQRKEPSLNSASKQQPLDHADAQR